MTLTHSFVIVTDDLVHSLDDWRHFSHLSHSLLYSLIVLTMIITMMIMNKKIGMFGPDRIRMGFSLWLIAVLVINGCRAGSRTSFSGNRLPDIIPGQPGVDYPVASRVPSTSFRCEQLGYPGFFADPETGCQVQSSRLTLYWLVYTKRGRKIHSSSIEKWESALMVMKRIYLSSSRMHQVKEMKILQRILDVVVGGGGRLLLLLLSNP